MAVCNDIGLPSLSLLGTGVQGVPMHSLSLSKIGVTEVAQLHDYRYQKIILKGL